ncbi:SPOR domain-containing protein [Mucilaginibacter sp.]|uniref:HU domain-containing protein n=1 Tax=Mucilaginibacter sp. TaxID=1882438 RepID=UPI0025D19E35|nr:SPOR domain-containing protein [Mucilaginibacter sp.]
MNLADYLSELLAQYEEVSVPGLGYFVRERVNGFYNDKDSKFYPPYHRVKFVPQPKDDDVFTQYVADKKNISLASSKYFAEKFVAKLKEQALTGKYLFADLGLFYTAQDQLVFKANEKITDDPAFYGYPPLTVFKQGQTINDQYTKPLLTDPAAATASPQPKPVQPVVDEPYFEEEAERKRGLSIWMIILIAVTALALAAFGVYKFYPQVFDKIGTAYHRITGKTDADVPVYRHEVKADTTTVKKPAVVKDTVTKAATPVAPVVDTAKHVRFDLIATSSKTEWRANAEAQKFKAKNIDDVKVLSKKEAPGTRFKISVGTFTTPDAAEAAKNVLVKAGKIPQDSYIIQINQ